MATSKTPHQSDEDCIIEEPDGSLRRRTEGPAGITAENAVRRGESAIAGMTADYLRKLALDIGRLKDLLRAEDSDPERLRRAASEVHDLAPTFGFPLTGEVAGSLRRYLELVPADDLKRAEMLSSHADALGSVHAREAEGNEDPKAKEIVESLGEAVARRRESLARDRR